MAWGHFPLWLLTFEESAEEVWWKACPTGQLHPAQPLWGTVVGSGAVQVESEMQKPPLPLAGEQHHHWKQERSYCSPATKHPAFQLSVRLRVTMPDTLAPAGSRKAGFAAFIRRMICWVLSALYTEMGLWWCCRNQAPHSESQRTQVYYTCRPRGVNPPSSEPWTKGLQFLYTDRHD